MSTTGDRAREAMLRRSREKNVKVDNMQSYYLVIGGFCVTMALGIIYTIANPSASFAQMPVIDEGSMLVHNGQGHSFMQGPNDFFDGWTISDAKKLFEQGLADTPNLDQCRSGTSELEIPDSYDWRNLYPQCNKEAHEIPQDCQSGYVRAALSAVEDRICKESGNPITLSAQEVLDCDKASNGCKGGNVNKVLTWGKRKGFMDESCYESDNGECPEDHIAENACRQTNNFYKIIDFCLAQSVEGIKREILTNGPVIAQMTPHTDFLTYSEGVYSRTYDSFKYQGNHVVKILGWESDPEGGKSMWIVENTWGPTWGEAGYARVASDGNSMLDFYAIGFAAYPQTMAEFYQAQQMQQQDNTVNIDPSEFYDYSDEDEIIPHFNLDDINMKIVGHGEEEEMVDDEL